MTGFKKYSEVCYSAFQATLKRQEVISKKQEIFNSVYEYFNLRPTSILFVGFSPAILDCQAKTVYVTEVSSEAMELINQSNPNAKFIEFNKLSEISKKVEVIIALEEFFTFAVSDDEQKALVNKLCGIATDLVITTLRDYKNLDFKEREFSQPAIIRGAQNHLYLEFNDWSQTDRASWKSVLNEIVGDELTVHGPCDRRTMYFKQLAKFSYDAGSSAFTVHKNLMYKSLFKKNYEHVISIHIENNYNNGNR